MSAIPIIDLFAGPGGLGEGFSSLRTDSDDPVFQICMSVEMEQNAHNTLRLRSFVRKIIKSDGQLPSEYLTFLEDPSAYHFQKLKQAYPEEWKAADQEAVQGTLIEGDDTFVNMAKERLRDWEGPLVLIGGPPCQAYSLVGRARRTRDKASLEKDVKQTLYKCYLRFIEVLRPTIFVMENVKGILSAQHRHEGVFAHIEEDMRDAGYTLHSLVVGDPKAPKDFIVKAERYGIPQARHRVILLGVRNDAQCNPPSALQGEKEVSVSEAFAGIPKIRSDFTRKGKPDCDWNEYIRRAVKKILATEQGRKLSEQLQQVLDKSLPTSLRADRVNEGINNIYQDWYRGHLKNQTILVNHQARKHMAADLERYLFCAAFAAKNEKPAKLYDFPKELLPNHKNAAGVAKGEKVIFADRFRVQMANRYSTTVTSHISKDGHYFIHPDYTQCRSLTVREAARLQTFPDDYYFEGNRTAQYQQVGNAVPPLLAQQIARVVARCLGIDARGYFDSEVVGLGAN